MKRGRALFIGIFLSLLITAISYADNSIQSAEDVQFELYSKGLARVIVTFRGPVNTQVISKYGGELIRVFESLNALVCIIPEDLIEEMAKEPGVMDVSIDGIVKAQSGYGERVRDPLESGRVESRLRSLLARIKADHEKHLSGLQKKYSLILSERLTFLRERIIRYNKTLRYLNQRGYRNSPIFESVYSRYKKLLADYYAIYGKTREEYDAELADEAKGYALAEANARTEVAGDIDLYGDGAIIRWNNREDGVNSIAAWQRYNVSGMGVTIVFVDGAVNYNLTDLINYTGGVDFVDEDSDPFTDDPDDYHGTHVVTCSIATGENKAMGVAPRANYKVARALMPDTSGFVSDMIAGVEWAYGKGEIINLSLGYSGWISPVVRDQFEQVCNDAFNNGQILVAGYGPEIPQQFESVIVVGAHSEGDNGNPYEGDIRAPGNRVYVINPANEGWWGTGTSLATAHASALFALQLQYNKTHGLKGNHKYHWALMVNSAVDGGRIYAAQSQDGTGPLGAIDLLANNWPFDVEFEYRDYAYTTIEGYPAYYTEETMNQDITIINNSSIAEVPANMSNIAVNVKQYYANTETLLPGFSNKPYGYYTLTPDQDEIIENAYYIEENVQVGLFQTNLTFLFNASNCPHKAEATMEQASLWCPPGPRPQTGYGTEGTYTSGTHRR